MDQTLFLVGIFVLFIALTIIPQAIQRRRHEQELSLVRRGDWVATVGGIVGQVLYIDAQYVKLRISQEGDIILFRRAIRSRIPEVKKWEGEKPKETEETSEETAGT